MLKSPLFWKTYLAFALLNLLVSGVLVSVILGWLSERAHEEARLRLRSAAALLQDALGDRLDGGISGGAAELLQQEVAALGADSGFRLTLIDAQGVVLADSMQDSLAAVAAMENHANRPEVLGAQVNGQAIEERSSGTLNQPFIYLTRRIGPRDAPRGYVRAAVPIREVEQSVAALRRWSLGVMASASLAVLGLSWGVVSRIVSPVLALSNAAESIARGDYSQRAFVSNRDELGTLATSFNRMSQELGAQLTAMRDLGERQALVLGGMVEGVIAIDDREHILFANSAAGELFGFLPPVIEGRPLLEVVRNHTLHEAVGKALTEGAPQRLEIEWQGPEKLTLSVQISPLAGVPSQGAVLVLHDTTELRRLERIRQEFVANVSHELKTPLSSIKAYTETLLDGALHDEQHAVKFLRRIEEQADRLHALIQDMLSLARIESAQQPFEITAVNISEAVAACVDDYRAQAEAKRIELAAESDEPLLEASADPEGLRVILNNLVDNAIKYTPPGGRVTLRWRQQGERHVRIEVEDTGIGIPRDELPRVFERFYRVDKARSRELGGTGLGLSIVKHLAQSFHGAVSVTSTLDEGTTFAVRLPLAG